MAPRTTYANLADGLQPFSLFDQSFADVAALAIIPCTAAGANTIVLTPVPTAFSPFPTYANYHQFSFVAAVTSTGPVTINVTGQTGSLGALPLYRSDLSQATAGDLVANVLYVIAYNTALNSGSGGFQITGPNSKGVTRIIVAAGDVTVGVADTLIILNKTVSQITNVNLPASATKIGAVKIVDWKGDSGMFPITVIPNGVETFNDAQTTWPINGAGASVIFTPIPTGLGYAV